MHPEQDQTQLLLVYNSEASFLGKLNYNYRRWFRAQSKLVIIPPTDGPEAGQARAVKEFDPACAAHDITHGGFPPREKTEWQNTKRMVEEASGLRIVQLHRDQMGESLHKWSKTMKVKLPFVAIRQQERITGESFALVLDSKELAGCRGDTKLFCEALGRKGGLTA